MTDQVAVDTPDGAPDGDAATATDDVDATEAESTVLEASDGDPAASAWSRWRERRRSRVSKWDRPPEPHDWRFFVGNLGKVLIATGILMFGFVAYQLWGTGIETARAQNKLENQFEELLAEFGGDPAGDVGTATDDRPGDGGTATDDPPAGGDTATDDRPDRTDTADDETVTDTDTDISVTGDDTAAPDDGEAAGADQPTTETDDDGADAAVPVAVDLSDAAVEQDIPPIIRGDVLARLEIPAIGRTDYVVPGVNLNDLKSGPGHYPDTPLPGQLGNAAIAGHRTTYGGPFFDVDQLGPNDELIVTMANGDRFVYLVTGVEVVSASDYWVVTTTNPDIAELTLTSCHPKYTARDRIIVRSVLDPSRSSNVGIATFYELEADPDDEPIPGDDPVLQTDPPADAAADDSNDDDATAGDAADDEVTDLVDPPVDRTDDGEVGDVGDDTATDPVTADAETADRPTADDDASTDGATGGADDDAEREARGAPLRDRPSGEVEDAFGQGWFDDRDAWPQIALWGTALTIISLAAYAISRRFRHDSIGFLAGIGPFLFALYFFFQNVNRLLPPGL